MGWEPQFTQSSLPCLDPSLSPISSPTLPGDTAASVAAPRQVAATKTSTGVRLDVCYFPRNGHWRGVCHRVPKGNKVDGHRGRERDTQMTVYRPDMSSLLVDPSFHQEGALPTVGLAGGRRLTSMCG